MRETDCRATDAECETICEHVAGATAETVPLARDERDERDERRAVLIVEDELSVCDALRMILESHGYSVTTALNGSNGIRHALRERFGLLVVDLRLPDMTGLDVVDAARRQGTCCSFVLITSHGTPDIFEEARRRGASAILSKPFLPSDILRVVTEAFARG